VTWDLSAPVLFVGTLWPDQYAAYKTPAPVGVSMIPAAATAAPLTTIGTRASVKNQRSHRAASDRTGFAA
jgi:hypothetical protein